MSKSDQRKVLIERRETLRYSIDHPPFGIPNAGEKIYRANLPADLRELDEKINELERQIEDE